MKHSWKRCRLNGCGECCHCGQECECEDNWVTVQDLTDFLLKCDPNKRVAFRFQDSGSLEEDFCFMFGIPGFLPVKYNDYEITYRVSDGNGGWKAPEGYEDAIIIEIFNEEKVTFKMANNIDWSNVSEEVKAYIG